MNSIFHSDSGAISQANPTMTRRAFLKNGSLIMLAAGVAPATFQAATDRSPALRVGLVTDLHFADVPGRGTRNYRDTLPKLREAVDCWNKNNVDLAIELGDFIDVGAAPEDELRHLKTIEAEFARFHGPRHHVQGNHCVWSLTKSEFRQNTGGESEYYSFDKGDFHFIILDGCYRADGVAYGQRNFNWKDAEIPPAQREWLQSNLKKTKKKSMVFLHHRLDTADAYAVKSAALIRSILEQSGHVTAVFQGHYHKNDYKQINGIHYCTLAAMVEGSLADGSAYASLAIFNDGSLKIEGFHRQSSKTMS